MANQFPTESSTSDASAGTASGSGKGAGAGGNGPATSIGTATGLGATAGTGSAGTTGAAAQRTMDRAVQATHEAVDRAAGSVGQAAERLRTGYDHLMEVEEEWAETARTRVRENPLGAIALALVVGMVVGRLTAHR